MKTFKIKGKVKLGYDNPSGFDLTNIKELEVEAFGNSFFKIKYATGVYLELSDGLDAEVRPRSSALFKHNAFVVLGTIDQDYRGKIIVQAIVPNHIKSLVGKSIAQLVIREKPKLKGELVNEINEDTKRGDKGFGSSD